MAELDAFKWCMPDLKAATIASSSSGLHCIAGIPEPFPSCLKSCVQVLATQYTLQLEAVNQGLIAHVAQLSDQALD